MRLTSILSLTSVLVAAKAMAQSPGDVVITEIMADPTSVDDALGEWFEVYNHTASTIHLQGWHIKDGGTNDVTISSVLDLPPDAIIVIGRSSDVNVNGGLVVDHVAAFPLANTTGTISLTTGGGTVIDSAPYTAYAGASTSLAPAHWNATDNDSQSNWCAATSLYNSVDHGTPHQTNNTCIVGIEEQMQVPISWRITNEELIITANCGTYSWSIFDVSGRRLLAGRAVISNGNLNIDIGSLPKGAYLFRINDSGEGLRLVKG